MNRKTNRTILLIVVLIITVLSASLVAAQETQNNGPGDRGPGGPGGRGGEAPTWMADYVDENDAAIANLLGISVEELEAAKEARTPLNELAESAGLDAEAFKTAMDAIRDDILDLAVADGVLSEEEATQIRERNERDGAVAGWTETYENEYAMAVANLLGISVEELDAAKEAGTRLRAIGFKSLVIAYTLHHLPHTR
jgi:predicted lipoprotein